MFRRMGKAIIAIWPAVLIAWLILALALKFSAPAWQEVATDGELRHLPDDAPSRIGAELYQAAFPKDLSDSSIVLIVYREDQELTQEDERFIVGRLVPSLKEIAGQLGGVMREQNTLNSLKKRALEELKRLGVDADRPSESGMGSVVGAIESPASGSSSTSNQDAKSSSGIDASAETNQPNSSGIELEQPASETGSENEFSASDMPQVVSIASIGDFLVGPLLRSADGHATVVSVNLTSGFLKTQNKDIANNVTQDVDHMREAGIIPDGLHVSLWDVDFITEGFQVLLGSCTL